MTDNFSALVAKYTQTEFAGLFKELVKLFKIKTYVELGVRNGYMFNQISPNVKRAVAVDMEPMNHIVTRSNVEKYQYKTDDFAKVWKGEIDFLFIDADHRKEQVLKDFDNFSIFVKEGTGLIALHDTHPVCKELLVDSYCSNSWEAAWEIRTNPKYNKYFEIITLPGPFAGLSLLRKSKDQLSWRRSISEKMVCNNISVIIPFYNQVDLTYNLLLNIKQNTYPPIEVILINNGSSMDTSSLSRFQGLNIKYIKNKKNVGVNPAWNMGMQAVDKSCNLISILNNDIVIDKSFFEKINYTFNSDSSIGIALPETVDFPERLDSEPLGIENFLSKVEGCAFTIKKEIADKVRPIPNELVIFYGDYYLFDSVTRLGYRQVKMVGNKIYHKRSTTIKDIYREAGQSGRLLVKEKKIWLGIKEKLDKQLGGRQKIYDCFPFFNELDLLEIRLHELNTWVDKFVLVECTKTHRGKDKPLYFNENKDQFKDYLNKIIHIIVEDAPKLDSTGWNIENFQRNCIMRGLNDCNLNDIIIISDVDEIPKSTVLEELSSLNMDGNFFIVEQKLYYYYLNAFYQVWYGPCIVNYSLLKLKSPQYFRDHRNDKELKNRLVIKNGGWHFSYLGNIEQIQYKLRSFAHSEYDTKKINNPDHIKESISNLKRIFNEDKFQIEDFYQSDFPKYIKENEDKFKMFIRK